MMVMMMRHPCHLHPDQIKVSDIPRTFALNCLTSVPFSLRQLTATESRLLTGDTAAPRTLRAASNQPGSLAGASRTPAANRLVSEPPSDSRSFIEENGLYRSAKFSTPRSEASASPAPSQTKQSAPRSSARIAARNSVPRDSSVEMSPSKGRGLTSRAQPLVSDSIDEDNTEDPLNTPRIRGVREASSQPPNSEASRAWTRPDDLERDPDSPSPSPRPRSEFSFSSSGQKPNLKERVLLAGSIRDDDDSEDDETDREPTPRPKRTLGGEGGTKRPNIIQDARSSNILFPRPDQSNNVPSPGRPLGQQPGQRLDAQQNGSLANNSRYGTRSDSSVVNAARGTRPVNQPPSRPSSQHEQRPEIYPRLPPQPQSPAPQYRPTLLQSPPRRPVAQSRPSAESRNDGSSRVAKSPAPSAERPQPDNPSATAPFERPEPVSGFNFVRGLARGIKSEDLLNKAFKWSWNLLKLWAILAAASIFYFVFIHTVIPVKRWDGIEVHRDFDDEGLASWRQKFLQVIPWIVLHPFSVLTGNLDYADFRNVLDNQELRFSTMSAATSQMRRILPELIQVNVKSDTGAWSIDDRFWNALDAEMREGGLMYSLLSMEKSDEGTYSISEPHWQAIKQRIEKDNMLGSSRPASGGDPLRLSNQVMEYVHQHTSKAWADWLKANEDAISKLQGKPGKTPSPTYQELYGEIENIMNKRLKALGLEQGVVTREEFIREIEDSVVNYRSEVKGQLEIMDSKLSQAHRIAIEAKRTADAREGISREEVARMIDQAMRSAISDAALEAIAKGHKKAHFDGEIVHKRDYFNQHRGAIIDDPPTSQTYSWLPKGDSEAHTKSGGWSLFGRKTPKEIFREGGEGMGRPHRPELALEKWEEDGECWCAALPDAKDVSATAPADLGIFTAGTVIPQYFVVEHINAGASFDPKSTPRDVEFWIRAPQDKRARALDHWSKERWPAIKYDTASRQLLDKGYTKIGEFVYDNTLGNGEKQVFQFPQELVDMDAQTQQVLVRAKTNYGAEDHTCFYRLRLYGADPAEAALLKE